MSPTPRIARLLAELSLDEKARLTAGAGFWTTAPVERLGIPAVGLTDGPNGARGMTLPGVGGEPTSCTPSGSALGATWDADLVTRVGALIARDARSKGCRVLLAPTVNLHRSPLGGRVFESYSEDPLLAGRLAAGFVRGAQAEGVVTTVKHFAGNEIETERNSADSLIDERSLHELYLVPFELAIREGGALGIMTAYNRLNGQWCGDSDELAAVLGEWGFEGFTVSDWFAAASTELAGQAPVDLEMPGPGRAYGPALAEAVRAGKVDESALDAKLERILGVFERIGALDDAGPSAAPAAAPGDRELLRAASAASMVLLQNDGLLPLDRAAIRSLALIGPNASSAQIAGGGSAQVRARHRSTPLEALRDFLRDTPIDVRFARGCEPTTEPAVVAGDRLRGADGEPGFLVEWFDAQDCAGKVVATTRSETSTIVSFAPPDGVTGASWSWRAAARLRPHSPGRHTLALAQAGRARVLLDAELVLDGVSQPPPSGGEALFGMGSRSIEAEVELDAEGNELVVELNSLPGAFLSGARIGCRASESERLLGEAAAAAAACDAAVVVVGSNDEWESEGRDRSGLGLPGDQDELVARVIAANPRTVVVVNTGAPVAMPWSKGAAAILQCWFGGQELPFALIDVLFGEREPGGRLPTTFPRDIRHCPAYGNLAPENHVVRYGEGVFMGYRGHDARELPVLFPFGHGLSYTGFSIGPPRVSATAFTAHETLTVEVDVRNVGARSGSEVVQCYVAPLDPSVARPPKELKAFAKVALEPGEAVTVSLRLDQRAFAHWHTGDAHAVPEHEIASAFVFGSGPKRKRPARGWWAAPGRYEILIARSAADILHRIEVALTDSCSLG
jgi:beta-glucosidase